MERILDYFSGNDTVMSDFVAIVFEGGFPQHREGRLLDNIGRVAKVGADTMAADARQAVLGAEGAVRRLASR